jgi:beta-phosphoglucomutase
MIKGVLFDMDGVIVDSEKFICNAASLMFEEYGFKVIPDDFLPFIGMGEIKYLGGVAEKYEFKADIDKIKSRTYQIYEQIISNKLKILPGVIEFITKCKERDLCLALATSADRIKMEVNLREIGLLQDTFHTIVTGLDVENRKPSPDIYIKASMNLRLDPSSCLVVEDSVSGIKSGKSAGCKCLAITSSLDVSDFFEADWLCNSLTNVPPEVLEW